MVDENQKTVAKGTFWGLAGNVSLKFTAFLFLIIAARLFTQEEIGTYYLALSLLGVIFVFADMGFSASISRYVPFFYGRGENEKANSLLSSSYLISGALSCLIASLLFISAPYFGDFFGNWALPACLRILSLYLVINTLFSINNSFLLARKKAKISNVMTSLQDLLNLVLAVLLFYLFGPSSQILCFAILFSYSVALLFSFLEIKKEKIFSFRARQLPKLDLGLLREIVPFGLTLALVGALWLLVTYIDKIMLGYFMPGEDGAIAISVYTFAASLAGIIMMFPASIKQMFFPTISELHGKNKKDEMSAVSASAARWILFLIIPVTMIFVSFPGEILGMLYGARYAAGATVLGVFSIGLFIKSLSYIHILRLAAFRMVKIELLCAAVTAVINIALNFALIPRYGIDGAALSSAVSFAAFTSLCMYCSRKFTGFGFIRDSYKPIISGLIAAITLFALRGPVVNIMGAVPPMTELGEGLGALVIQKLVKLLILGLLFLIACAIYLLALMFLKSFRQEDTELLSSALRKVNTPAGLVLFAESIIAWGKE